MTWPNYVQRREAMEKAKFKHVEKVEYEMPDDTELCTKDVVGWIYSVLTTLDAKASALMRLNGVLIAAAAFLLGLFDRQGGTILSTTKIDSLLIVWSAFLSALSIGICLFVVNVSWMFLGKIKLTEKTFNLSEEITALDKASTFRQCAYRVAWFCSFVAAVGFLVEFMIQTYYITHSIFCGIKPWS